MQKNMKEKEKKKKLKNKESLQVFRAKFNKPKHSNICSGNDGTVSSQKSRKLLENIKPKKVTSCFQIKSMTPPDVKSIINHYHKSKMLPKTFDIQTTSQDKNDLIKYKRRIILWFPSKYFSRSTPSMPCPKCKQTTGSIKNGFDPYIKTAYDHDHTAFIFTQRWRCKDCSITWSSTDPKSLQLCNMEVQASFPFQIVSKGKFISKSLQAKIVRQVPGGVPFATIAKGTQEAYMCRFLNEKLLYLALAKNSKQLVCDTFFQYRYISIYCTIPSLYPSSPLH